MAEPGTKAHYLSILQDKREIKDPLWCPGCGDFTELAALRQALAELAAEDAAAHASAELETVPELEAIGVDTKICRSCEAPHYYPRYEPHKVVVDSGIGCAGQMLAYIGTNRVKSPHGRVLPMALGLKTVRPDLTVIPQGGDGDAFAIGGGHFLNCAGFNADITYLVTNNEVYGLTKGQVSPSSAEWTKTAANPAGPIRQPVNPLAVALVAGWTFIARLSRVKLASGEDTGALCVDVIKRAIRHPGSSLIVFETECVTYNRFKTKEWLAEKCAAIDPGHDRTSRSAAFALAMIPEDESIPLGVYYEERRPTLHERLGITRPLIGSRPSTADLDKLLEKFS